MPRLRLLIPCLLVSIWSCSLLDRQGPPQILSVESDQADRSSVGRGQEVQLTLFTEDPDNDELDYQWTAARLDADTSAAPGAFDISNKDTLVDLFQDSVTVTWRAPISVGEIELVVQVSDGKKGEVVTEVVRISVTQGAPLADAGADLDILYSDTLVVRLDGSSSSDPELDELNFLWEQVSGPRLGLIDPLSSSPGLTQPPPADYAFVLHVNDGRLVRDFSLSGDPDTVRVRITDRGGR